MYMAGIAICVQIFITEDNPKKSSCRAVDRGILQGVLFLFHLHQVHGPPLRGLSTFTLSVPFLLQSYIVSNFVAQIDKSVLVLVISYLCEYILKKQLSTHGVSGSNIEDVGFSL
jgi:hypothetical protein